VKPVKSSDILGERLRRADEYVKWLRENFTVRLAILFGSLARGDWTESSDIDVLVVADELLDNVGENYLKLKQYMIEPIGYSSESFMQEIRRANFLILDALRYGKILYADEKYLAKVIRLVERVKEELNITYQEGMWRFSPKKKGGHVNL